MTEETAGTLRAAVLGASDGIVSTAALLVGLAAYGASSHTLAVTAVAAVAAGAGPWPPENGPSVCAAGCGTRGRG